MDLSPMPDVSVRPAVTCPLCHSVCYPQLEKNGYRIVRCSNCAFLFVDPMPTEEVVAAYYATTYRGACADFYPKDRSRRWRAFWRSLRFIPYVYNRDRVDLGCGGGHMLAALCHFARSGTGVDLSGNSIAFARSSFPDQVFFAEDIEAFAKREQRFDFVFSSELLEHLRSPVIFMETLRAITRPNAVVYLSAPDTGHRATPQDLAAWSDICPPEHLQWFNEANLTILFAQYGFVPLRRHRTTQPAHSVFLRCERFPTSAKSLIDF